MFFKQTLLQCYTSFRRKITTKGNVIKQYFKKKSFFIFNIFIIQMYLHSITYNFILYFFFSVFTSHLTAFLFFFPSLSSSDRLCVCVGDLLHLLSFLFFCNNSTCLLTSVALCSEAFSICLFIYLSTTG